MTQAVAPTAWHPDSAVVPTGWRPDDAVAPEGSHHDDTVTPAGWHPDRAVAPAGWYADPELPRTLRWWDGTVWTAHIQRTAPVSTTRGAIPSEQRDPI